ncbi:hypothetical protein IWZ01DRAFT_25359 [Phyllosticta capitalensis]
MIQSACRCSCWRQMRVAALALALALVWRIDAAILSWHQSQRNPLTQPFAPCACALRMHDMMHLSQSETDEKRRQASCAARRRGLALVDPGRIAIPRTWVDERNRLEAHKGHKDTCSYKHVL